ncbi:MAG: TIM barrel protein [Anaerolineae bacterium]
MVDRVLLSAGRKNIEACLDLANEYGLGIELMCFAYPDVLDGSWKEDLAWYQKALQGISPVTLHGPFLDLAPGSPDARINALVRDRYHHAIDIAAELKAELIVFHANFIGSLRQDEYRTGWHARNVVFWKEIAAYADAHGINVVMENMWEFDPHIIVDLIKEVDHPRLRACLDIGHAHLFSEVPFEHWLNVITPVLKHIHLNNNDGILDVHRALPDGVLKYHDILRDIKAAVPGLTYTLEMEHVEEMRRSLSYFDVQPVQPPKLPTAAEAEAVTPPRGTPIVPIASTAPTLPTPPKSADKADSGAEHQSPGKTVGKGDTAELPSLPVNAD